MAPAGRNVWVRQRAPHGDLGEHLRVVPLNNHQQRLGLVCHSGAFNRRAGSAAMYSPA
jgi:hypothetical protein